MTDLQKLTAFSISRESMEIPDVTPDDFNALPQDSMILVSIARSQARIHLRY